MGESYRLPPLFQLAMKGIQATGEKCQQLQQEYQQGLEQFWQELADWRGWPVEDLKKNWLINPATMELVQIERPADATAAEGINGADGKDQQ